MRASTRLTLTGSQTGVYVGVSANDYSQLQHCSPESISAYTNIGGALSIAANRISYVFDLRGPSLAVDTACSSTLVALHQACQSLRTGESTLALAAGVNIVLSPYPFIGFAKASMLSPTGRCHTFCAEADGYVRAEGGGILILKPLAAALRDRDTIHAVIRATGVNSDGRTVGLSLPNVHAQTGAAAAALYRGEYRAGRGRVFRGPRHRDIGGRSDRVPGDRRGARRGPATRQPSADRVDQDQRRPPGACFRHRGIDQGDPHSPPPAKSRHPSGARPRTRTLISPG